MPAVGNDPARPSGGAAGAVVDHFQPKRQDQLRTPVESAPCQEDYSGLVGGQPLSEALLQFGAGGDQFFQATKMDFRSEAVGRQGQRDTNRFQDKYLVIFR